MKKKTLLLFIILSLSINAKSATLGSMISSSSLLLKPENTYIEIIKSPGSIDQNDEILGTITKVGNKTLNISGISIEDALKTQTLSGIKKIEINAGKVTTIDWEYLRDNRANFTEMVCFSITKTVTVSDIPNTVNSAPYFNAGKIQILNIANVRSIGENAFYNCESLTIINFPEVTSVGGYAFINCINLTTANFPKATNIGNRSFYECSSLIHLNISEGHKL